MIEMSATVLWSPTNMPSMWTALKAMSCRGCITLIRLALTLYALNVAHKVASETLSKILLKCTKT